jgi:hypothetical protein
VHDEFESNWPLKPVGRRSNPARLEALTGKHGSFVPLILPDRAVTLNQRVAGSSPARLTRIRNKTSVLGFLLTQLTGDCMFLSELFAKFLKEKQFLANISPKTVRSYQQGDNAYQRVFAKPYSDVVVRTFYWFDYELRCTRIAVTGVGGRG